MTKTIIVMPSSNRCVTSDTQKAIDEFNAKQQRLSDPAYLRTPEGRKELALEKKRDARFNKEMEDFDRFISRHSHFFPPFYEYCLVRND